MVNFPVLLHLKGDSSVSIKKKNLLQQKIMKPVSFKQGGHHLTICNRNKLDIYNNDIVHCKPYCVILFSLLYTGFV